MARTKQRARRPKLARRFIASAPLVWYAYEDGVEGVEKLLAEGADVEQKDKGGNTALHAACLPEIASMLLKAGANINATNDRGSTPLHHAATVMDWNHCGYLVPIYLAAGADVNAVNNAGLTPLLSLLIKGPHGAGARLTRLKHLVAAGADLTTIVPSTRCQLLSDDDGAVGRRHDYCHAGQNVLHVLASTENHWESADQLATTIREFGLGYMATMRDDHGLTPLDVSMQFPQPERTWDYMHITQPETRMDIVRVLLCETAWQRRKHALALFAACQESTGSDTFAASATTTTTTTDG